MTTVLVGWLYLKWCDNAHQEAEVSELLGFMGATLVYEILILAGLLSWLFSR